jgi:hypothetical protein
MGTTGLRRPAANYDIPTAYIETFSSEVYLQSQQKNSRLLPICNMESGVIGEQMWLDTLEKFSDLTERTTRYDSTTLSYPNWVRRVLTTGTYNEAIPIERIDPKRMLVDPQSKYIIQIAREIARKRDAVIATAALGSVTKYYKDTSGDQQTSAATITNIVDSDGAEGLTIDKLIETKETMDENEVDDMDRFIVVSAKQISDLLQTTQVTSADYNSVRALVSGEVNTFLGFNFIRYEGLATGGSTYRRCFAGRKGVVSFAIEDALFVDYGIRRDLSCINQLFVESTFGAVRTNEDEIVEVRCAEAA